MKLDEILSPAPPVPPGTLLTGANPGTGTATTNAEPAGKPSPESAATIANAAIASARNERAGKPGRHKKDCDCENCRAKRSAPKIDGSPVRSKNVQPVIAPVKVVTPQERELAKQAIIAATNLMDSFSILVVSMALTKKDADPETQENAQKAVVMTEPQRKGIAESGAAVLEKYDALRFAPEVSLGLFVSSWLTGVLSLIVKINRLPDKADKLPENGKLE